MHAVTYQFCTLRNTRAEHVVTASRQLEKSGITLSHFYKVDWFLDNGDLDGNQFTLVIRDLKRVHVDENGQESLGPCQDQHVRDMVDRLRRSGFINFYGEQRVGSAGLTADVGVRAFDVGRAMLQQDFSKAIDLIMTGRSSGDHSRESDTAKRVRQTWKDTEGDSKATLKAFQGTDSIMTRERTLLKGLNRFGNDKPLDAIRCLSYSVRTFWINAYQSFVWNQAASLRMKVYGKKVVKGDLYQDEGTGEVKIVDSNDAYIQISQIVLPLPGNNIIYPENEVGSLYKDLLARDNITFANSGPPESCAKGTYRRIVVKPEILDVEMIEGEEAVRLTFNLPKGCYATMFLRELMSSTCRRTSDSCETP
jgi:tRNA pseudouridine13 synthase